jgi:HECT-domain (ubiquitin-transferase)
LIGVGIGKALFDHHYPDAYFTQPFYKIMLGRKLKPHEGENIDPEFDKNLQLILQHSFSGLGLELTFTAEYDDYGKTTTVELKSNGSEIPVTDENKKEYVA